MAKKILSMLFILALAVGLYAMKANAEGDRVPGPTSTAQVSRIATVTPGTCEVYTGIDGGTVNLRTCAGTSCRVLDILTEGESLTIVTAGNWTQVTRADGVTGWLYSKYCKGK
jgi:uncharacterized protein YgiM (DUF1202 family)